MLTDEQKKVVESKASLLLVNAYAGTGKTSTLIEFCRARQDKKILYLVYNSSMSREAKQKFEKEGMSNVETTTIHSFAMKKQNIEHNQIKNKLKPQDLIDMYPKEYERQKVSFLNMILLTIEKFCSSDYRSLKEMIDLVDPDILKEAEKLWEKLKEDNIVLHHTYLKLYELSNPDLSEYDYILVDEAQDLNPVMFSIVKRQKTNKVFVGDTYQSIYGFNNCINALEMLEGTPGSETHYLTKTWRCSEEITNLVNPYLKLLGARLPLQGNETIKGGYADTKTLSEENRTIICRTNAMVFLTAAENITSNANKKIHFVGGIKNYKFELLKDLCYLASANENQREKIKDPSIANYSDLPALIQYAKEADDIELKSRISIFFTCIENQINIFDIIRRTKDFSEKEADIILTTGHKSKGLEWNTIEVMPDFYDMETLQYAIQKGKLKETPKVPRQELNLLYVVMTRAKQKIYLPRSYYLPDDDEWIEKMRNKIELIDTETDKE